MVSELRSRKLKSSIDNKRRPRKADGGGKWEDDPDKTEAAAAGGGFFGRLLDWDKEATLKCSICAAPDSGLTFLRYFFKALEISGHGVPWIAVPVALMCYTDDPWMLELLLNLLAGIFLDLVVSVILKTAVRRPRPSVNQNDMFLAVSVDNKFSFPSGHCSRAAMLAAFFLASLHLTVLQTALLSLWTVGIAASRLCLGRHYVTDITFGMLIGFAQGMLVLHYWMPVETLYHLKNYFT